MPQGVGNLGRGSADAGVGVCLSLTCKESGTWKARLVLPEAGGAGELTTSGRDETSSC